MVLEGIVSTILTYVLDKYIDQIDTKQLNISLFSGKVGLKDVSIKKTALSAHGLPFAVVCGKIGEIAAEMPYTRLKSKPCLAKVTDIFVLGKMNGDVLLNDEAKASQKEYGELSAAFAQQDVSGKDVMTGIVGTILNNLKVEVVNLHIRIEHKIGDRTVSLGVILPLVKVCTVDEKGNDVFVSNATVLRKRLTIQGLSIYMDSDATPMETDPKLFSNAMRSDMTSNHSFLLHNFNLTTTFLMPSKKSGEPSRLIINTPVVELKFDAFQYLSLREMQAEVQKFELVRFYASCGRPNRPVASERSAGLWWAYSKNAAWKQRHPITFDVQNALTFLQNRKKVFPDLSKMLLNPNPKDDEKKLDKLQEKWGTDVFVQFRAYTKYITEQNLSRQVKPLNIASSDLSELAEGKDMFADLKDAFTVEFSVTKLIANLTMAETHSLLGLTVGTLSGSLALKGPALSVEAKLQNIELMNSRKELVFNLPPSLNSESCAVFSFTQDSNQRRRDILFQGAAPVIFADVKMIPEIQSFLSISSSITRGSSVPHAIPRDSTRMEIEAMIKEYTIMNISMHLDAPVVKIPTEVPIVVCLGAIDFVSVDADRPRNADDPSTYYDNFLLGVKGVNITMNDQSLCDPFDANLSLGQSFVVKRDMGMTKVSFHLSAVALKMNHDQLISALSIVKMLDFDDQTKMIESHAPTTAEESRVVHKQTVKPPTSLSLIADASFDKMSVAILDKDYSTRVSMSLSDVTAHVSAISTEIKANFSLSSISGSTATGDPICDFGNPEQKAITCNATVDGNDITVNLATAKPKIYVAIPWIKDIIEFADIPSDLFVKSPTPEKAVSHETPVSGPVYDNDYQILKKLQDHPYFHFSVKLSAPIFVLPGKSNLIVELGMFELETVETKTDRSIDDVETFYDRFKMQLTDLSIKFEDQFICHPISLTVGLDQSFIQSKTIAMTRVSVDLDSIALNIDKEQVNKLMGLADEFATLGAPKEPKVQEVTAVKEVVVVKKQASLSVNVSVRSVNASLIKADRSVLTALELKTLDANLAMVGDTISCKADLNDVNATYEQRQIISFDKTDGKIVQAQFDYNVDETDIVFICARPVFVFDLNWVMDLKEFFTLPPKLKTTIKHAKKTAKKKKKHHKHKKVVQPKRAVPIPKIKANISLTEAMVSMVLIGNESPIAVSFGIGTLKADIPESQSGTVELSSLTVKIDERYVLEPLSMSFGITVKPSLKFAVNLEEIKGVLDVKDCRMLMELKDYFEYVFGRFNQSSPAIQHSEQGQTLDTEAEKPDIGVKLGKLAISLKDKEQTVTELQLNELSLKISPDQSIDVSLAAVQCPGIIDMRTAMTVAIKDKVIDVQVPEIGVFVRQDTIGTIIAKLTTGDQVLKFEKKPPSLEFYDYGASGLKKGAETTKVNVYTKPVSLRLESSEKCLCSVQVSAEMHLELTGSDLALALAANNLFIDVLDKRALAIDCVSFELKPAALKLKTPVFKFKTGANDVFELVEFLQKLIPNPKALEVQSKPKPVYMNKMSYEIDMGGLDIEFDDGHLVTSPFVLGTESTGELLAKVASISLKWGEFDLLNVGEMKAVIGMNISSDPPKLLPGEDVSILDAFEGNEKKILHGVSLDANMSSIKFEYSNKAAKLLADYIRLIMSKTTGEKTKVDNGGTVHLKNPFAFDIKVNGNLGQIALAICGDEGAVCNFSLNNMALVMNNKDITASLGSLVLESTKRSEVEYPKLIESGGSETVKFTMTNGNEMNVELGTIGVFADVDALFGIACLAIESPFLPLMDELQTSEDDSEAKSEQEAPKMTIQCKLESLKLSVPVQYGVNSDLLSVDVAMSASVSDEIRANLDSLSCYFETYKGPKFDPFVDGLNGTVILNDNNLMFSTKPSKIAICPLDITSILYIVNQLTERVKSFDVSRFTKFAESKKKKQAKGAVVDKAKGMRYTLGIECFEVFLNQDRATGMPLIRLGLGHIASVVDVTEGVENTLTVHLKSIDYFSTNTGRWNMLLEPFRVNLFFVLGTPIKLDVSFSELLNVNFSYMAVQDIIQFVENMTEQIKCKSIAPDRPPKFRVLNSTGVSMTFVVDKQDVVLSPDEHRDFDLPKDTIVGVRLPELKGSSIEVQPSTLLYPKFLSPTLFVTQEASIEGTTAVFSSLVSLRNKTDASLVLVRKKGSQVICQVPPGSTVAIPYSQPLTDAFGFIGASDKKLLGTFEMANLKKRAMPIECCVNGQKRVFSLSPKFGLSSASLTIKIEYPVLFVNQFSRPVSIKLTKNDPPLVIEPGQKVGTGLLQHAKAFDALFGLDGDFGKKVSVKMDNDALTPVSVTMKEQHVDVKLALRTFLKSHKPQSVLTLFVPTVIFNRSNLDLFCMSPEQDQVSKFAPIEEGDKPSSNGIAYWSHKNFFISKLKEGQVKVPLHLSLGGPEMMIEHPIECSVTHVDDVVLLPFDKAKGLYVPLHYMVESAGTFVQSTIVTIVPQIHVHNALNEKIKLTPLREDETPVGDGITIESGAKVQIISATETLSYAFTIEDGSDTVKVLLGQPAHTTFVYQANQFVELQIQTCGCELVATFKPACLPQPVMITNRLTTPVLFNQVDQRFVSPLFPESTGFVAFKDPFGCTDLVIHIDSEEVTINLVKVNSVIRVGEFYVEVQVNPNSTKTVVISNEQLERPKSQQFDISVKIPTVNVSVIDSLCREIALLRVNGIFFRFASLDVVTIQANVKSIQLDDLNAQALLRVACAGYPQEDDGNLLSFSATMCPNTPLFTACHEVVFTLEPIVLFADISFVSDMIYFFKTVFVSKRRKEKMFSLTTFAPAKSLPVPLKPFSAEVFTINQIALTLFFKSTSVRPMLYPVLLPYLKVIPDVTNGQIVLPAFEFEDCTMTQAYINREIIQPLIKSGVKQGLKMFFNLDMFSPSTGTKSSNFSRRTKRLMNGEVKVIGQMGTSALLRGGEAALNIPSKLLHFVGMDGGSSVNRINATAKDTASTSVSAVGNGFVNGISGLWMDPIRGGRESGVGGVFKGIGKGILGLVTKPITGLLDGGVGAISSLRKLVNGEDADVIAPMRIARAFPLHIIGVVSPIHGGETIEKDIRLVDSAQFALQAHPEFSGEYVHYFFEDVESKRWFGITNRLLFSFAYTNGELEKLMICRLSAISAIRIETSRVQVTLRKAIGRDRIIQFIVIDYEMASEIRDLIDARAHTLSIGKKS